jgi:hypothetical protein
MAMALALAALSVQANAALAADPQVTIAAVDADDGTWRLSAKVTDGDGAAQSQISVTFTAATVFFGERWVPLGTAVTDTSGTASLIYTPSWNGAQTLVARAGTPGGVRLSEPMVIDVIGALPGIALEPDDLPLVRAWALPIGVAVVVAVWVVLAFLFFSAVIGIARRSGPEPALAFPAPPEADVMETVEPTVHGGSST